MIDEADRDGDGEVNQPEFLRIMKKTSLYWMLTEAQEYVKYTFLCNHFQVVVFMILTFYCTIPEPWCLSNDRSIVYTLYSQVLLVEI